jgi:ribosomal-protein-alanine N-acetyltransferase
MQEEYANEIINDWHYDGVYSFYDMKADEDDLKLFTDKTNWKNVIFAVLNNSNELIGWSSFYIEDEVVWLALGLKPELTGKGLGEQFVSDCIQFIKSNSYLNQSVIKLEVALFNQRAIKVYNRVGFAESTRIIKSTHIGELDFLQMTKTLSN